MVVDYIRTYVFLVGVVLLTYPVLAQNATIKKKELSKNKCLSHIFLNKILETDSLAKKRFEQNEQLLKNLREQRKNKQSLPSFQSRSISSMAKRSIIDTIPVVVHLAVDSATHKLITDDIIVAQIDSLTLDYSGLNADTSNIPAYFKNRLATNTLVFKLAKRDPNGNYTNGIVRNYFNDSINMSVSDTELYESFAKIRTNWDINQYVNIVVTKLDPSSILGFAYFPGTTNATIAGIYINYRCFGIKQSYNLPYANLGRTLTHELGHFFNLYHIWGDDEDKNDNCSGSDFVEDTPNQKGSTSGCPRFPVPFSADNGPCSPSIVSSMFNNFMDYSVDNCLIMFTKEQQQRMQDALTFFSDRKGLATSTAYVDIPVSERKYDLSLVVDTPNVYTFCDSFSVGVTVTNHGNYFMDSFYIQIFSSSNTLLQEQKVYQRLLPEKSVRVSFPQTFLIASSDFILTTIPHNFYTDIDISNNTDTIFSNDASMNIIPFTNDFEAGNTSNWNFPLNNKNDTVIWTTSPNTITLNGTSETLKLNGFSNKESSLNTSFFSNPFVFNNLLDTSFLTFDLSSYKDVSSKHFTFDVYLQEKCQPFQTTVIFSLQNSNYYSALSPTSSSVDYTPSSSELWKQFDIALNNHIINSGSTYRIFFDVRGNITNNIYIDNLKIFRKIEEYLENNDVFLNFDNITNQLLIYHKDVPQDLKAVSIYDFAGKFLYQQTFSPTNLSNRIKIQLSYSLPSGIHIAILRYQKKTTTKKIFVAH